MHPIRCQTANAYMMKDADNELVIWCLFIWEANWHNLPALLQVCIMQNRWCGQTGDVMQPPDHALGSLCMHSIRCQTANAYMLKDADNELVIWCLKIWEANWHNLHALLHVCISQN